MFSNTRFRIFILFFYGLIATLFLRTFYMQVILNEFFHEKSENQLMKFIHLYPHRGNIYDRNHHPLAITKTCYSVCAFPLQMKEKEKFILQGALLLEIPEDQLRHRLYSKTPFLWIKRRVSPDVYAKLHALNIKGLEFIKEEERVYPHDRLAAHVLGFVGIDNQGLGGMEYLYDRFLKGSPGKIVLQGDPRGRQVISGYKKVLDNAYDGGTIITTLDSHIQYFSQKALRKGVEDNGAKGGIVIVMDPKNGDILAMASYPEFDPNHWIDYDLINRKNKVMVDVYEPGSVFKLVTISGVLEEKLVKPNDIIYVPETMELGGRLIREAHAREPGETDRRTVGDIIEKSLNVGTTILARKLGEKKLYYYIKKFGFGEKTGLELPGESRGLLRDPKYWSAADIGMISFGQGVAVTPIQMIAAVGAIANQGEWVKPRILDRISYHHNMSIKGIPRVSKGHIISEKTSKEVVEIMIKTVETGTGTTAKIPGFYVAGKTGTAQKPSTVGRGYVPGEYIASFIGFFPARSPKYIILVAVDTPRKSIYGSSVAGPVFKEIGNELVRYFNIVPERAVSLNETIH